MNVKSIFGAAAVALTMGMLSFAPANALTVSVSENGTDVTGDPQPFSVDVGDVFSVEHDVLASDLPGTLSTFDFQNNTTAPAFVSVSTVVPVAPFGGTESLTVSIDGGAAFALLTDGTANIFSIAAGSVATFVASVGATVTFGNFDYTVQAIPLPASILMLLGALGGLGFVGRRRSMTAGVA